MSNHGSVKCHAMVVSYVMLWKCVVWSTIVSVLLESFVGGGGGGCDVSGCSCTFGCFRKSSLSFLSILFFLFQQNSCHHETNQIEEDLQSFVIDNVF